MTPINSEDRALIELRPCPFCGRPGRLYGAPNWGVTCNPGLGEDEGCGASVEGFSRPEDATSAWNTRTEGSTEASASGEANGGEVARIVKRLQSFLKDTPTERWSCCHCGHVGGEEDANPEQDLCSNCGRNAPSDGPDKCAHCGAEGTMCSACPKCGGSWSFDQEEEGVAVWRLGSAAREELPKLFALMAADKVTPREDMGNHDCLAKRRPGEPMFIFLGRDPDAHNLVRLWAERRLAAGGNPEHCQMGLDTAARMQAYAADPANRPASAPDADAYPARSLPREAPRDHFADAGKKVGEAWKPDREAVARIIEPDTWSALDFRIVRNPQWSAEERARCSRLTAQRSLDKADAIIALPSAPPAELPAEVVRLVKAARDKEVTDKLRRVLGE